MALTRINNNQITDATIVASSKLQDNSISAGKLANNLNYGSNLTITGNLTVNGTSTTLDTVNTLIEDPILLLAKDQTGSAALDIGFVGERGDDTNIAWIWDEGSSQFAAGFTSSDGSANTITLSSYADARVADITMVNLAPSGNVTTALNASSTIEAGTSITAGTTVTATGNVSGGNLTTAGQVAGDNAAITNGITAGTTITATGNVSGGNVTTAGQVQADNVDATNGITAGTTITATGNVSGGNVTTGGQVQADNVDATNGITAGTTITATGNVSGGNVTTAGQVAADNADITNGITAGTTIVATGNVTGGNLTTAGQVVATGNITGGNLITAGTFEAASITATGNVTGGNLVTAGAITDGVLTIDDGSITGGDAATFANAITGGSLTDGTATISSGAITGATSGTFSGTVTGGTLTDGTASISSGAITGATNITGSGTITGGTLTDGTASINSGAITGATSGTFSGTVTGGTLTDGTASINSGAITGATSGSFSTTLTATGNITGGNVITGGLVDATGSIEAGTSITAGTTVTATGNVSGGNLTTGGDIDASGDIAGLTITSETFRGTNPTISSTGTDQNIILDPNGTGDIDASNSKIIQVATPTADGDAANKAYVDSVAEGLDIKESCVAATTGALPAVTYNNGSSGVGATLTADANGALATIDGVTLVADERLLVKNQASALQNGIYVVTTVGDAGTAFVLTRAGDFDGSPASEIPGGFTFIEEGTTNADAGFVCTTNAPVTVGSTAIEFTQFSGAGSIVAGDGLGKTGETLFVNVDDVTTAIVSDEVVVKTSANLTTPNIGVANGDSLTVTGNLDGVSSNLSGVLDVTGNIDGGNIESAALLKGVTVTDGTLEINSGAITSGVSGAFSANVSAGNLVSSGAITDGTFSVTAGVFTGVVSIDASGNVDGGNLISDGLIDATTSITAGTTITATGNVTGGNLVTAGAMDSATINTTGEATLASAIVSDLTDGRVVLAGTSGAIEDSANLTFDGSTLGITGALTASTTATITGNITGGNLITAGLASVTGNVTGGNLVTAGAMDSATLSTTGEATMASAIVSDLTSGRVVLAGTSGAIEDSGNFTFDGSTAAVTGAITASTTITATGNITGGNLTTAGTITDGTLTISSGAIASATTGSFSGNVTAGNLTTAGITDTGSLTASTTITATGNITGGNLTTAGDVTGDNLKTGNITIATDDITSAGTAITVNQDAQDVDFIVEGSSNANLLTIDAGTDTIVIGSASTTTGATLKVDSTDSQMIPVGTTAQRPTGVTGMIRFNTTLDQFEFYDSNSWTTAGSDFTVIASETFSGDNSTTAFTLGSTQTTASCIVSINGVVQEPTTAYAVSGTTLTFTEAPLAGDTIEVREITTTSTLTGLASNDTSSSITTEDGGDVAVKGNIIPSANVTYDLGSTTERWNDLYLAGNSIVLGSVVIKNTGGNAIGFFGADGTTPGVIDANVEIAGDSIQNGTSLVDFSGTNGDVQLTAGGTQSLTVISSGANVVGDFATTGDVRFLDGDNSNYVGFQAPTTVSSDLVWTLPSADAGVSGYALVSDGAGTLSFAAAGATVSADTTTNTDFLLYFASTTTGALTAVKQDSGLIYNPSTGTLTSAAFSGDGSALTALNGSQVTTGTIAAARVATLNQNTTGTAGGLSSAVTVSLTGDVTGSATFTSAGDTASITTTIAANSVALGTDTTGSYVQQGATSGNGLSGSVNAESGTFTVTSNATNANTASTIVFRDGSGNFSAGVITATATQARYADLAEMYAADGDIEAGTVVHFAGEGKLAACDQANHHAVAGIVSTDPAYLMNTDQEGVALAISGRVPCKVTGVVNAGDLMVSAGNGRAMANNSPAIGTVIGKAIESNAGGEAVIEVLAMMM